MNIKELFYQKSSKFDILLITNFFLVLFILLINSFLYFHELGYDAGAHRWYIEVLPFNLPTNLDTREFFSPPLAYIFPSILDSVCDKIVEVNNYFFDCTLFYGKATQLLQVLLFISILLLLLKISQLIEPSNIYYKRSLLMLFTILTVNYKTFAMIRGEPYISFFMFCLLYLIVNSLKNENIFELSNLIKIGVLLGLMALSRQWGFLFFPSIVILLLLIKKKNEQISIKEIFRLLIIIFVVAFIVCGWFYIHLFIDYGSFTTFNREPTSFKFTNQPETFYFGDGSFDFYVFKEPFRIHFRNQLVPVLYSDTWGDYWGYFLYNYPYLKSHPSLKDNTPAMAAYTGRVNLVSLLPTAILIIGLFSIPTIFYKKLNEFDKIFYIFTSSAVLFIFVGYLWVLIKYPYLENGKFNSKGDIIKATYIIHLLHILPFFGAKLLDVIRKINHRIFHILFFLLTLVFIHNIPSMVTRFAGITN